MAGIGVALAGLAKVLGESAAGIGLGKEEQQQNQFQQLQIQQAQEKLAADQAATQLWLTQQQQLPAALKQLFGNNVGSALALMGDPGIKYAATELMKRQDSYQQAAGMDQRANDLAQLGDKNAAAQWRIAASARRQGYDFNQSMVMAGLPTTYVDPNLQLERQNRVEQNAPLQMPGDASSTVNVPPSGGAPPTGGGVPASAGPSIAAPNFNQTMSFVASMLARGAKPDQIQQALSSLGVDPAMISRAMAQVGAAGTPGSAGAPPASGLTGASAGAPSEPTEPSAPPEPSAMPTMPVLPPGNADVEALRHRDFNGWLRANPWLAGSNTQWAKEEFGRRIAAQEQADARQQALEMGKPQSWIDIPDGIHKYHVTYNPFTGKTTKTPMGVVPMPAKLQEKLIDIRTAMDLMPEVKSAAILAARDPAAQRVFISDWSRWSYAKEHPYLGNLANSGYVYNQKNLNFFDMTGQILSAFGGAYGSTSRSVKLFQELKNHLPEPGNNSKTVLDKLHSLETGILTSERRAFQDVYDNPVMNSDNVKVIMEPETEDVLHESGF